MTTQTLKESTIPFTGFYESTHSYHVNEHLEQYFQDFEGSGELLEGAEDVMWNAIDYSKGYDIYAREYASNFIAFINEEYGLNLKTAVFDNMERPKEYNFTTDRLFIKLSLEDTQQLFNAVDKDDLKATIKARFTSYDGFISFYSNDIEEWLAKPLEDWDCNEIGTLFEALIGDDHDEHLNLWLVEYYQTQNEMESCISEEGWQFINSAYEAYEAKQA